eukprot:4112375-Pyramimonas_sp.AAC.1
MCTRRAADVYTRGSTDNKLHCAGLGDWVAGRGGGGGGGGGGGADKAAGNEVIERRRRPLLRLVPAMGIFSLLLPLVPATDIFSLPFCDWCPLR